MIRPRYLALTYHGAVIRLPTLAIRAATVAAALPPVPELGYAEDVPPVS